MVSALRQRAVTEAAAAAGLAGTGERVEPTLMPEGVQPPVITDEVVPARAPAWRRVLHTALHGLQRLGALVRRLPLRSLALVALGMGLALFGLGLVLYLRPAPSTPAADTPAPAASVPLAHGEGTEEKSVTSSTPQPPAHAAAAEAVAASTGEPPASALAAEHPAAVASAVETESARAEPKPEAEAQPKADFLLDPIYGKDGNTNGVPDALDRWLTRTLQSPVTQEAARQYYRVVLPLASKLHLGIALSKAEKLGALRAAECYLLTAGEEGLRVPPNLNDRVLMLGEEQAARMKALFKALQGVDFPLSANRQQACGG